MICQVPILSFVPVLCIAVSVISHHFSYILCVAKIGFEDNALRGGENDRIAKHSEKKQATADPYYQLICQMKTDLDWLSFR